MFNYHRSESKVSNNTNKLQINHMDKDVSKKSSFANSSQFSVASALRNRQYQAKKQNFMQNGIDRQSLLQEYRGLRDKHRELLAKINMNQQEKRDFLGFQSDQYLVNPYKDCDLVVVINPKFGKLIVKQRTYREMQRDKEFRRLQKNQIDPDLQREFIDIGVDDSMVHRNSKKFKNQQGKKDKDVKEGKYQKDSQIGTEKQLLEKVMNQQFDLENPKRFNKNSEKKKIFSLNEILSNFLDDKKNDSAQFERNKQMKQKISQKNRNRQELSSIEKVDEIHYIEQEKFNDW